MDFKTAVSELAGYSYSRPISYELTTPTPKKRELVIPERAESMRNVFAYLCQTRKIDSKIVEALVREGLLYQDKRGNAVFLHKGENGLIVGAEIQGTNTFKRFKGVAAGTTDSVFSLKIGEPNRAYVFESAIVLLSFKMLANQQKMFCISAFSSGSKRTAVFSILSLIMFLSQETAFFQGFFFR